MNLSRRHMIGAGVAALSWGSISGGCAAQDQITTPIDTKANTSSAWNFSTPLALAVQEIYPEKHNNRIHQAGGFIATNGRISGPTNKHFSWQPGEEVWREETPLPTARHHPQLISFKGQLLAVAGFESRDAQSVWIMQNSGWALNSDGQWGKIPDLPAPCGEAVLGITSDGQLHLAGGRTPIGSANAGWQDHGDTDHHFMLSGIGEKWERAAPCLSKRCLLYTSPSPRDGLLSRMPSSA